MYLCNELQLGSWSLQHGLTEPDRKSLKWFEIKEKILSLKLIPYFLSESFHNKSSALIWHDWNICGHSYERRIRSAYLGSIGLVDISKEESAVIFDPSEIESALDLFFIAMLLEEEATLISQNGELIACNHSFLVSVSISNCVLETDFINLVKK